MPTTLQPGQMLGPYQITSQIGKGGMATVYKAYQPSMDRYVALKVVAGQFVDEPSFMDRFRQEARVIARLEHPHILPVYDFGESDGTPYMVMRFLEAGTLTERLDAGRLSIEEIDHIFSQLTDALGYAHEKGVIHRDIKPSNAMLDNRGDVFLTDFGIAKIIEGSAGLTATGAITGTPSYMSPEQAQGKKVDQRSDIYSLGIMLFEMLTGRVPFEAETPMAVLFRQIQDPPPPLSTVRPDLPYTLEMVLLKALTKDPNDRYPSMSAFRRAWKDALADAAAASVPAPVVLPETVSPPLVTMPPAAKTVLTPPPPPVTPATPAKKPFNWKRLVLIGLPLCLILLCLVLGFVFRARLLAMFPRLRNELRSTQVENANELPTTAPAAAAPPDTTTVPAASGASSWVAANSVFSIAFRGDEVLTAGAGGLTIWNRKDDSFTQLTTANGLPSGNAGAVFVDTDKSLWVGTDAGIVHIEDDESTVYDTDDGLDANYIVAIARSGDLLFAGSQYSGGAGGGLNEFDGTNWKPVPGFPSAADPDQKTVSYNVHQIVAGPAGNVWVATDSGIAMLNVKNQQWRVFKTESGLSNNSVYSIYINEGNLFAGTAQGGVMQFNGKKQVFESYLDLKNVSVYDVYGMQMAQDGTLWFAGGNVARYKPDTKQWTAFNADARSFPAYSVTSMGMDDQGVLYFGTNDSGLVRYVNGKFEKLFVPNALHYGQYGRIVPAPDGKLIFVQLYANGADQFDPANTTWSKVPLDQDIPRAFDKKGQMWSGSGDGVWVFGADNKKTHITKDQGLPSSEVYGVVFGADGTAYIATGAGVAVFDGTKVTDVYTGAKNGLISDVIYTLFMASDGSLWVGEEGGFSRRLPDGSWQHYTPERLFGNGASQYFLAFVEDSAGNVWVPTYGDGLYLFPKTGKPTRILSDDPGAGLPSNYLNAAALASDGALWLGTEGQGVVRYDGKNWTSYTIKDGLLANSVDGIYIEPGGLIWFATTGGISRLKP